MTCSPSPRAPGIILPRNAGAVPVLLLLVFLSHSLRAETVSIPDTGWNLWPDTKAEWKDDALYLPDEVDLAKLPVNPPTGGWGALSDKAGITVTLPSTVEEHYWGKFGLRPYTRFEYTYGGRDPDVRNGNYEGVSWWWRDVKVPASFAGKIAILHIRGARQRAEIYVNEQLVGYDIIEETAFDSDITKALRPGQMNRIAIRITNPGGWMDWQDFNTITWGKYTFHRSHGFGGLDRDISITGHQSVYLQDTWVLNTPQDRTITAHARITNTEDGQQSCDLLFKVIDQKNGEALPNPVRVEATIPAHSSRDFESSITCAGARIWALDAPRLYTLRATIEMANNIPDGPPVYDTAERPFGFRWFEPRGIGSEAGLYLNGRRVRLYTAISWGFWGYNGLWPTPELAEKEVRDAKTLNLDMLNFHRDIGKEEVLAKQDQLGLLRYMEPGGGIFALGPQLNTNNPANQAGPFDTSGKGGEPSTFGQRYMVAKLLRMVEMFRSHPSLVIYMIQNETEANLDDPHLYYLLRKMHELDPSRVIATKSGISPNHQAWFAPYAKDPSTDDATGHSGWYDHHTVGGPGAWQDKMYVSPTSFTHSIDDRKEIVDWGEMLGAAVADNHALMVKQIEAHGGQSYDLQDHKEILAAYHAFLDKWGFRSAFPTDDAFFRDLGNKCYDFWGRVIQTARLSESNDILTISGWESTSIENHSGLVDNLRNLKGDAKLLAPSLAPLLPVVEAHSSVVSTGSGTTLDLFLLNETEHAVTGQLHLTVTDPKGKKTPLGTYPAPEYVTDQFVYPIKADVATPVLSEAGKYTFDLTLDGSAVAHNSHVVLAVATARPELKVARIGIIGGNASMVQKQLTEFPRMNVEPYGDGGSYDLIISAQHGNGRVVHFDDGTPVKGTEDQGLYTSSIRGKAKQVHFHFVGLASGTAKVTLYFCDQESREAGKRQFDVEINGNQVLHDFDIFAEAGGANTAVSKTFDVGAPQGAVDISAPAVPKSEALFNAIKIEAGGKVTAVLCGGEPFTDKSGQAWTTYVDNSASLDSVLKKVRTGTPLLILTSDESGAVTAVRQLADAGALKYNGSISIARAPWMGGWIFVRKHPLYDGLPVNEVMKGDYQLGVDGSYGVMVDGPQVAIVAAYSRDHDRNIGAATFTTKLGKGEIVFQGVAGMHPVMEERWLGNAVGWLLGGHRG